VRLKNTTVLPPGNAKTPGAVEGRLRCGHGQPFGANAAGADSSSRASIMQWCCPWRRQQAGIRDSSTLPVHPDRNAPAGAASKMGASPTSSISRREKTRRIGPILQQVASDPICSLSSSQAKKRIWPSTFPRI
jgi:hypothetical protein